MFYFFKPDKITEQTIDLISFDPRLITENNLIDDNRPYRYEQNSREQPSLFTNNENFNENDNNNEDYTLENQTENRNEAMIHHINENTSEYTTPESKLRHKMHHKLGPQQTITLLESQLELSVQDQIHMNHNHTQILLHDATLLSTFPLI